MTEVRWLDEREQQGWRSLMAMQEALAEFTERQLRVRHGLSHADFRVLAHLSESVDGRLRSFELGRLLRWEKSRLSQHLGRMQTRGLVSRERCLEDLRGAVVTITPRGTQLIESAAPDHAADVRSAVLDPLEPAELAALTEIADKIRNRLTELESPDALGQDLGGGRQLSR